MPVEQGGQHGGQGSGKLMEPNNVYDLMTQAARGLQGSVDVDALMQLAVEIAVRDVQGADAAALTIVRRGGKVETPAASHEAARRADELQYAAGEGPCLSAVFDQATVHVPDIAADPRWPKWTRSMTERSGYRSMLVNRLFASKDRIGALNLYSSTTSAFDEDDADAAEALAAHIAVAIHSARQIEGLSFALDGRTVVGQAQGIMMERFGLDAAGAFAVLTRVSSESNRKLRDIARELVETRHVPGATGRQPAAGGASRSRSTRDGQGR